MRFLAYAVLLGSTSLTAHAGVFNSSPTATVSTGTDLFYTDDAKKISRHSSKTPGDYLSEDCDIDCAQALAAKAQEFDDADSVAAAYLPGNFCVDALHAAIQGGAANRDLAEACDGFYKNSASEAGEQWTKKCDVRVVLREKNGAIQVSLSLGSKLHIVHGSRYFTQDLDRHEIPLGTQAKSLKDLPAAGACTLDSVDVGDKFKKAREAEKNAEKDRVALIECNGQVHNLLAQEAKYKTWFDSGMPTAWVADFSQELSGKLNFSVSTDAKSLPECDTNVATLVQAIQTERDVYGHIEAKHPQEVPALEPWTPPSSSAVAQ